MDPVQEVFQEMSDPEGRRRLEPVLGEIRHWTRRVWLGVVGLVLLAALFRSFWLLLLAAVLGVVAWYFCRIPGVSHLLARHIARRI